MTYRVIQAYTGQVGSRVLRALVKNPNFEVVGLLVSGKEKHGRDAGEIVGIGPIGVKATMHLEEILELEADCVSWNGVIATWPESPMAVAEPPAAGKDAILRLLRSGKNIYTNVGAWYTRYQPEREALEAACQEGGVSIVGGGNIPGLVTDAFPLFVAGYSGEVTQVWCKEADHVALHPSAHELQTHCGFGLPIGQASPAEEVINNLFVWSFRQSAHQVAAGMGLKLDDFRLLKKENAPAREDIVLPNGLKIAKGTAAGVRWTCGGFIGRHQWYTCVCELTCAYGLGADWRQNDHEPQFSVKITGTPSLQASFSAMGSADDIGPINDLNAARAINLIPHIVAAPPGCRDILELPFVTCNHGAPA